MQKIIYDIIFGYESRVGKIFDVTLIVLIISSVTAVLLDSVAGYHAQYGEFLYRLEWLFTILFTIEYGLRLYSTSEKRAYIFSFYGIIDLLSILPTYIAFLFPSAVYLVVIRIMRVLRIFRILKLLRYMGEANMLYLALLQARRKILVFLFSVINIIIIFGALIFIIEGPEHGFNNIPQSIYWAIVTITTVGYGDIAPQTPLGQFVAAIAMISGYAFIAVPTGIIGAELMQQVRQRTQAQGNTDSECVSCHSTGHDGDAFHCKYCGNLLNKKPSSS
ncbi:MAG: ion transporter [SAR86 cluster bacterium]|uniref:Ion transporter n=1 Tax=SAR86 cluster bacterium TaxID=2030880 RepID=A0A2A5B6I8_9GAMM|nr:MAG: ion transporter [SAR86 cluster bacterium]